MTQKKHIRLECDPTTVKWHGTDYYSQKIDKQMDKICKKFNLTQQEWSGHNADHSSEGWIQCIFAPEIPEALADDFVEFVEAFNK